MSATAIGVITANALYIAGIAGPLLLMELLKDRVKWIERNHGPLSVAAWLIALVAMYSLMVHLGFEMNTSWME